MIAWRRTYRGKIGKMDKLVSLSHDAVKHLKKAHGLECELYAQIGGDPTCIGLVGRYKDMGALGKMEEALADDEGWRTSLNVPRV